MIGHWLRRLRHPLATALGLNGRSIPDAEIEAPSWGWVPQITLHAGVLLVGAALLADANRRGFHDANAVFNVWLGLFLLPVASRLVWTHVSRWERIALLLVATAALFAVRSLHEPGTFVDHDAFLHWATTNDILETGALFRPNPLLPISSLYPGLEIATAALVKLTGLSVFAAGQIIVFASRMAFVSGLFLLCERTTASARVASVSVLVYMGAPSFVLFDTMFSYGSLALTFMVLALLAEALREPRGRPRTTWLVSLPLLAALAITHHLTSFITAGLLTAIAVLEIARTGALRPFAGIASAILAIAVTAAWSAFVGNPSEGYLGPVFENAIEEAIRFLSFQGGRIPFVAEDGTAAPRWQLVITLSTVSALCLGLAAGFFRALVRAQGPSDPATSRRRLPRWAAWESSWLVLLTLVALAYPLSIVLRMTRAGWEIGNRISPFAYLGVGIVVAIAITAIWTSRTMRRSHGLALGAMAAMAIVTGIVSGSGNQLLGTARYRVAADQASVEWMGIGAAQWSLQWLGPDNRFFADRTNRLLLATHGQQQVITTLYDSHDLGPVVFAEAIGPVEIAKMRATDVAYLMLDLRLTSELPVVGWYFDPGMDLNRPPDPAVLLKFSKTRGVSRLFDNGFISIVDIARLRDRQHAF